MLGLGVVMFIVRVKGLGDVFNLESPHKDRSSRLCSSLVKTLS